MDLTTTLNHVRNIYAKFELLPVDSNTELAQTMRQPVSKNFECSPAQLENKGDNNTYPVMNGYEVK